MKERQEEKERTEGKRQGHPCSYVLQSVMTGQLYKVVKSWVQILHFLYHVLLTRRKSPLLSFMFIFNFQISQGCLTIFLLIRSSACTLFITLYNILYAICLLPL